MCFSGSDAQDVISDYDINYEYVVTKVGKFIGQDGVTDQQQFVTDVDETGKIEVNKSFVSGTRAAIGKTPLFKVVLKIEGVEAATAYVRVGIVDAETPTPTPLDPIVLPISQTYDYKELYDPTPAPGVTPTPGETPTPADKFIRVKWTDMTSTVLGPLNITNEDFTRYYSCVDTLYYVNNVQQTVETTGVEHDIDINGANINTNLFAKFTVNNDVDENTSGKVVYVFHRGDSYPDVRIEFSYVVSHNHTWPALNPDYVIGENMIRVKGRLETVTVQGQSQETWVLKSQVKEHFKNYLAGYQTAGNHEAIEFALQPLVNGVPVKMGTPAADIPSTADYQTGATIANPADRATADFQLTAPMETTYKDYIVTMYEKLKNGHYCESYYTVRFVCPFTISLTDVTLKTLVEPQSVDLAKKVVIKDTYGTTIYEDGAYTTDATRYNLPAATVNGFDIVYTTEHPKDSFGGNLTLPTNGSILTWDNDGGDLQYNKYANYKATVTIPGICKLTDETGKITILSVANSVED